MAGKVKKKRIRYDRIILTLLIVVVACIGGFKFGHGLTSDIFAQAQKWLADYRAEKNAEKAAKMIDENFNLAEISSAYIYLARLDDGLVLLERRAQDKMYPASLTKMMTVMVAIEQAGDLEQELTVPRDIFAPLQQSGASMAGFIAGEKVSVKDLLYGAILPSGGEACLTLAQELAGSEAVFVALMNKKAQEIGMRHTHFTNTVGLHDAEHYTTAEDMALLLKYCLENEQFRTIFTTKTYQTAPSNRHPQGIALHSTVLARTDATTTFNGGEILGGKSGYTTEAGLCLASLARKNGEEYLLITAQAEGDYYSQPQHILEALLLYGSYLQ